MGVSEETTAAADPAGPVPAPMVALAAATVTLADRRTERRWHVEVAAYELAAVPVTRAQ
jgi:hypothetical protein